MGGEICITNEPARLPHYIISYLKRESEGSISGINAMEARTLRDEGILIVHLLGVEGEKAWMK